MIFRMKGALRTRFLTTQTRASRDALLNRCGSYSGLGLRHGRSVRHLFDDADAHRRPLGRPPRGTSLVDQAESGSSAALPFILLPVVFLH